MQPIFAVIDQTEKFINDTDYFSKNEAQAKTILHF